MHTGPQGPAGVAGPKGMVDINSCYRKFNTVNGTGAAYNVTLSCNNTDTEFVMDYYYLISNAADTPTSNVDVILLNKDVGGVLTGVNFSRSSLIAGWKTEQEIYCCKR